MDEIYVLGLYRPHVVSSPLLIAMFDCYIETNTYTLFDVLKQHGWVLDHPRLKLLIEVGVLPVHENGKEQWLMLFKHPINEKIIWPAEPKLHAPLVAGENLPAGTMITIGSGTLFMDEKELGQVSSLTVSTKPDVPPYEGAL